MLIYINLICITKKVFVLLKIKNPLITKNNFFENLKLKILGNVFNV